MYRHINAFATGAKEVNKDTKVYLYWLNKWYDPKQTSEIAKKMISYGIEVIGYTEDSPAVAKTCQQHYENTGKKVYTFSHYSPMVKFGIDFIISGQLVKWGLIYEDLFIKILSNKLEPNFYYWFANSNSAIIGKDFSTIICNDISNILKTKKTQTSYKNINLYDYIFYIYNRVKDPLTSFDPFTGPVYSNKNEPKITHMERASFYGLISMD